MPVSISKKHRSPINWEERAMHGAYGGVGKKVLAKTDSNFQADCQRESVEPTARQYSKWARKIGRWAK